MIEGTETVNLLCSWKAFVMELIFVSYFFKRPAAFYIPTQQIHSIENSKDVQLLKFHVHVSHGSALILFQRKEIMVMWLARHESAAYTLESEMGTHYTENPVFFC